MPEHAPMRNEPEAVAVFDDVESLEAAIDELRMAGVPRDDISLLAGEKAAEDALGGRFRRIEELEDDPDAPRAAFVSEESLGAAEGALIGIPAYVAAVAVAGAMVPAAGMAAAIAAAVVAGGTGAAVGGALAARVGESHAERYRRQLEHGGLLLWVRLPDEERKKTTLETLERNSGRDVHVHGWTA
ncbi:MAG TPA: hypothetical protein VJ994_14680 [Paracoccaceae bacterium]|nr:hypothetical protein [Paracoccaceae bacterium]